MVTALFRFSRRPFNSTGEGGTRECVNVCMYAGEEEGVIDRRPGKPFVPLLPSLRPRVIRQVTWIFAIGRCTRCFQKWRSSYLLPSLPSPVVVKRVNSVVASYLGKEVSAKKKKKKEGDPRVRVRMCSLCSWPAIKAITSAGT